MELLVCVINREEEVERVLAGFVELGITGATVVPSVGLGRMMSRGERPALAGLRAVKEASRPQNTTVFSVVEDPGTLAAAIELVERVCGGLDHAGSGIVFSVPLSRVVGLAARVDGRARETEGR